MVVVVVEWYSSGSGSGILYHDGVTTYAVTEVAIMIIEVGSWRLGGVEELLEATVVVIVV